MGIRTLPGRQRRLAPKMRKRMRTARTESMLLYRPVGAAIPDEQREEEWDLLIRLRMKFILGGVLLRLLLR